ncbi:hypothetical protein JTB14_008642 [Gonioctena quinquepunctata]|nr:hypothetical protein JTB14_008642 [Gonioctena quinquepunctata]
MFCGDFCHHTLCGSSLNQSNGYSLLSAVDSNEYVVVNDGPLPNQGPSAVDLTIVSPNLMSRIKWLVSPDKMGSDKFPIVIDYNCELSLEKILPATKWNEKFADWVVY